MTAALALAQQAPATPQATAPSAAQPAQSAAADSKAADSKAADSQAGKAAIAANAANAAKAAEAQKKADEAFLRNARNAGFKPQRVRGNLMFCQTAAETGSNFPVKTCYSEYQVRIKLEEYEAQRQQLEGMHSSGMVTN